MVLTVEPVLMKDFVDQIHEELRLIIGSLACSLPRVPRWKLLLQI